MKNTFQKIETKELNNTIDTKLRENMTFTEVCEELDKTENNSFYISLHDKDVLEAIKDEKEIAEQLNLWLVCIMPQCIYVALY